LPSAEYIFIFDYLTVILPRRLLVGGYYTARYSTDPLDVALNHLCRLRSVDISTES